jgi:hypothetical protein
VVENSKNIPFNVKRIYYLYDVPSGEKRGGNAHYELEQYIIAASGSFVVEVKNEYLQMQPGDVLQTWVDTLDIEKLYF